jgi:hypothetical protein
MMISGTRLACRVYYTGDWGDAEMIGIFSCHTASMQMLETCGFVREGVHKKCYRENGITMDEVVYVYLQ